MKMIFLLALLLLCPLAASAAEPWQEITMPPVADAAKAFPKPPKEYSCIYWAIWGGPQSKERILADIEQVKANGGGVYMINNSRGVMPKYFTPKYLDLVKFVVEECKKRGMKVWIEGDDGYPAGFAGGMISRDYPQLGMQGIVADAHCTVTGGQTVNFPLPTDTLGIVVRPAADLSPSDQASTPHPISPTWCCRSRLTGNSNGPRPAAASGK